ncbi:hypothetical protein PYW08_016708 [Mythimna loreyi]|uniref:Uncharacterized protein n=1 Tax=Mythimna loreyi TaxID=667449 RepID=A0ACC2QXR4_9NEOP|nr:hypothetical protein PYW08_016708 [Mythimna loreyi]
MMNRYTGHKYCVIKFWKSSFKCIDEFVCIPSSWILRKGCDKKVLVAYPVEHPKITERRVKQRQRLSEDWRGYVADVKYGTDSYEDAQNFINEQIGRVRNDCKSPNAEKNEGPEKSGKKKLNHNMAVPDEFVVLKNGESATKIKLKRLEMSKARKSVKRRPNVRHDADMSDSIESSESESEVEFSSSEEFESTSKNQLSSLYEEFLNENFNNDNHVKTTTNFERSTSKTQTFDPITIKKDKFLTGLLKFVSENPEKTKEALKLRTPNNNIPTASTSKGTTAKLTKVSGSTRRRNVEKKQSDNIDSSDEDTSKGTTTEMTKISGSTRSVEKEQNNDDDDGDDEENQILNKKQKFILPPEYDESDSRWTLKYHKSAPELVELLPDTGVYVNAVNLSTCKRASKDCNTLARNLMPEIFKMSALSTCSLIGRRTKGHEIYGVRPGLNKKARIVLMEFVKEYGLEKGWQTNTNSILSNMRNKLRDARRKQK